MAIFPLHRALPFFITHAALLYLVVAYSLNESSDIHALLEFKSKITSDPFHVMQSWNESTPLCQWYGVICGSRHRRVNGLYLNSSKITGTISPSVGNLSFLRELVLENNSFTGDIPPQIGCLNRLRSLWLSSNLLTGTIPSNISNCYNLKEIDFRFNHLEGEIPIELCSMTKLTSIRFSKNNLHGQIPPSFGNLSYLEMLGLAENKLSGVLPFTLGWLNNLKWFSVRSNRLSGFIPHTLFNLSSLLVFEVSDNQIHGSFPSDLFNTVPKLMSISVGMNQLTGNIPLSLSNASNLVSFQTAFNEFTGKLPSFEKLHKLRRFQIESNQHGTGGVDDLNFLCSLTNNTNLVLLSIARNNLGGQLHKCIANFTSLIEFYMQGNDIFGPIPVEIGNLINLETFVMSDNEFSGEIPYSIGNLRNLVKLHAQNNKLSGNIPSLLGNLTQLIYLSFGNNKLQGKIPQSLGKCKNLHTLYLYQNGLSGSIPQEIFQISSLLLVIMWQNRLTGPLPEQIGNLENLNILEVSNNMLSQEIPSGLTKCINLRELYLSANFFEGMIPPSLGSLRGIDVIDLSHNNLSGQIPRSLSDLIFLKDLNLSYNNLEGPVPENGVFKNITKFNITGNKKLCGGIPELTLPKCSIEISNHKASHKVVKVILCVLIGLFGMFFICLWLSCRFRKRRNTVSENSSSDSDLRLTYQSLLKATNGFSLTNKLGSGSFGTVYKAVLDTSKIIVAVKVFDLRRHGASRSFLVECEVLKRIRHRNLVKILKACSGFDFSGNEFKALVYEFMANGSLEDWLHPVPIREGTNQAQKHLGFLPRLNIAIDVACALDYLHSQYDIPIVHCDIKPSNVLLNHEMIGHVGDFGISKLLLDASDNHTTGQTSSTSFKGTIGYIPPEYGMGASVSTQGDVYSYGILLLELFTGKRPNDDIFHGSININYFVKASLPDKVVEIVDPTLHAEMEDLSITRELVLEYLIAIFQIGVLCSANVPGERKSMKDVVGELKSIRNMFLQN